jgi:hypothetical protein
MNSNLILHCGARRVTREVLASVPTPPATETWHPIPHIRLVEEVERSLKASGMGIVSEAYGLTEDNARMFGLLQVSRAEEEKDYGFVVGLRGALDKTLSRGLAVGSSVFCCDNLAFSSEIVMHRKQTINILRDLPLMVDTSIGLLAQRWGDQARRIDVYKKTAIGLRDADHLLAEMAGHVFPWQKFEDIRKEFTAPRHAEFLKETLWALFNSVTEFLKPRADSKATGLWTMPSRTGHLHKLCDDYCGLVIDATVQITPAMVRTAQAIAPSAPVIAVEPNAVVAPLAA